MAKGAKHHFRLGLGLNGKNKIRRKEADEWEMRREIAAHISREEIIREGKGKEKRMRYRRGWLTCWRVPVIFIFFYLILLL
ncbi:hypothetical protein NC653_013446 [Populus alba x Populus x berolinensis]|uniref:Uncharacterized protein n=1 Tax=Populus alba x Populus x berolinensis TaxID=444605 RepID=A0AAD6QV00_9ROSI|nr:hypothetical protein NC653_013446 [Populus alba x Populus x berolinensis]